MTVTADIGAWPALVSPWPDPVLPEVSLPGFLLAAAAERQGSPALVDASSGQTMSYAELADGVRRIAAGLRALGLRPGQVIAILAPNCPEWLLGCFGTMAAGGVVTGVNPVCPPAEAAAQLADAGARFLLTTPALLPAARAATDQAATGQAESRPRIIVTGPAARDTIPFGALLAQPGPPPGEPADPSTLALLPYSGHSSSSAGPSMGAMLTHRACLANVVQMLTAMPAARIDRILAAAPFCHPVGFAAVACRALFTGATLVTLPRFDVTAFLAALQDHRITQTFVAAPVVHALARHPAVGRYDLSSLEWLGCGTGPLDAGPQQAAARRIGCPVGQGYGTTEATAAIALWPAGTQVVAGSSGRLLPGVAARITDPDTGADLSPGAAGELRVRTPALMNGYLGHPEASAAAVGQDGWLRTGDIARFDDLGNLFLLRCQDRTR